MDSLISVRRVLYELQRAADSDARGPTQPEIINYAITKRWPSLVRDLDAALQRLMDLRKAEISVESDSLTVRRYRLTHDGLVEEETVGIPGRRPVHEKILDEIRRPTMVAGFAYTVAGILIGYLLR